MLIEQELIFYSKNKSRVNVLVRHVRVGPC